jgi:hypothetical protein
MTEHYQGIVDLLEMLSATGAKKTLSRDIKKPLSTKTPIQVTEKDLVWLQKIIDNWNDYHVITAVQNLDYLVPLLKEFQRLLKKERIRRKKMTDIKLATVYPLPKVKFMVELIG